MSLEDWYWRLCECSEEAERDRLLAELRNDDATLANEIHRMLQASKRLGSFMQIADPVDRRASMSSDSGKTSVSQLTASEIRQVWTADEFETENGRRVPEQIGPYKLLEPIGEGGMGIVYLARQEQPVRRKLAIKIIKPGMDSRQVIARFEAERQALAMMEHPNIAKVLDAGTTDNGLPYFVMELVRGIPITEYCDRAKMSIHERLDTISIRMRCTAACTQQRHHSPRYQTLERVGNGT